MLYVLRVIRYSCYMLYVLLMMMNRVVILYYRMEPRMNI